MKRIYILVSAMLILAATIHPAFGAVRYVDVNATGDNSGASWANAYTNLQTALSQTGSGTDLWVAAGTYIPGTARTDAFQLKANVNLYGGFTNGGSLNDRDWTIHETILSGEIGASTNNDNCYHVVKGTNNVILDGFTITRGFANGTTPDDFGGGMLNKPPVSPVVRNCKFYDNFAASHGGGAYCYQGNAIFTECIFSYNTTSNGYGGGLAYDNATLTPFVSNCLFLYNVSTSAVSATKTYGGGLSIYGPSETVTVANCTFIGNSAKTAGGGAYINHTHQSANVSDCIFNGNQAATYGAGLYVEGAKTGRVFNCVMCGNILTAGHGAGMANNASSPAVSNCLFAGNYATGGRGGGLYNYNLAGCAVQSNVNCTFGWNKALAGGAIVNDALNAGSSSTSAVKNCILWGDIAAGSSNEIANFFGICANVSYSDIMNCGGSGGSWSNAIGYDGGGNISTNPLFVGGASSTWTANSAYDPVIGQTTLTNSSASWIPGALAGNTINPNTNQFLQYYIVTNGVKDIKVWGNVAALAVNGANYQIYNYRLQSSGGHWTLPDWVADAQDSACIDAGQQTSPYALEPEPNGGRINMGFDGNTAHASKSQSIPGLYVVIK